MGRRHRPGICCKVPRTAESFGAGGFNGLHERDPGRKAVAVCVVAKAGHDVDDPHDERGAVCPVLFLAGGPDAG